MADEVDPRAAAGTLTRDVYPIPDWIAAAMEQRGVTEKYRARPPYQQNDYIGWITRAKRPETQQNRLAQMLDELDVGGVYMHMKWNR